VTIAFFISGHGFGHASRQVEIINALAGLRPDVRVIIRSAVSPALLARTLTAPHELRPGICDTGIVQSSSVTHDDRATVVAAADFHRTFDVRVREEAQALSGDDVRLIVGDIPPLAFAVARTLNMPSVAIANFTWDWIYETHPGFDTLSDVLDTIRTAYRSATLALELPFAGGFEIFPRVERLPLVARHAARSREDARKHFGLPPDRRVALLSFGGYGMPSLDLGRLDCFGDWTVATTDRLSAEPAGLPHVIYLREDRFLNGGFRYEDLVAAADVVVTKPGYGIIAECIAAGTPMLYTSRGDFREYDLLVREMPRYLRARFIDQRDLFAGRWRDALDALVAQAPPVEVLETNGAGVAATTLERLI
jgi:L-arabinokinase